MEENFLWNRISRNLGLVEYLRITSICDLGFRPFFHSWPPKINITTSDWFTLEYLLACTSTTITLVQSHLENKDFDVILRNWMIGGLPNLKYLEIISMSFTDNGKHILGMNLRELAGKVIQTNDGSKKATIRIISRSIKISVTPFE
ncbi:hypothetical protein GCK72_003007 [Caenorhabditis remanei]|uniref:Sdz-33 F-box domain-containing protein n=1 Tax=Caenorhabditis remanei TaxID=31234 RepID=A0A6A5HVI7_CAERE|nr:hypothetical protein GCK72_003007 [Caenorhabditis remanei]KAF1771181.1 hypothetical protein GCK72_003007 [Caenorhabditis remanei]